MKSLLNISLAAVLVAGSIVAAAPVAMAKEKHHHDQMCISDRDVGGIIVLGAVLGAVTGGVGSALVYGGAYVAGGAAIGGGAGLFLGAVHSHHHCDW